MTTLHMLVGLRDREVDRAARATREAAEAVAVAMAAVAAARTALDDAITVREGAAARRLLRPDDECVAIYLERCVLAVTAAERALDDARRTLAAADHDAECARRAWMRAEARRDVMRGLADDERRQTVRTAERRADNDLFLRAGARR